MKKYNETVPQIRLGQKESEVIGLLQPIENLLSKEWGRRSQESFLNNGKKVEIYFARTAVIADGKLTDDEFTPYVFTDGILTGIGWTVLGGPKTQGTEPHNEPHTVIVQPIN